MLKAAIKILAMHLGFYGYLLFQYGLITSEKSVGNRSHRGHVIGPLTLILARWVKNLENCPMG